MDNQFTISRDGNILVAFDGSDFSKGALSQVIEYSKEVGCRATSLTVVTVLPPYEREAELGLVKNIKGIFKELGKDILSSAEKIAEGEGVQVETVLSEGSIHRAIINVAESRNCDLIVMARRSLTDLERALVGSVTARVIGYSPIDVLVMPSDSIIKWDNILLAIDGSHYSEIAAKRAISIAQSCGGKLKLVSVVDVTDEFFIHSPDAVDEMIRNAWDSIEKIKKMVKSAKIDVEAFVREGEPHDKIVSLAEELESDIICMGSHGRTGIKRLLMGSVTEKVIGNAPCPVLVVKAH
ncbi:MAG TPA: universal stress protein [Anaerolineae bacterium]|jgi:nucleotide-binding universal stress UspA family protein|nr:universal stress protein [Anaerolineae bacterium]